MPIDKERLFKKVRVIDDATSCWEWQGNRDKDGYGRVGVDRKVKKTHRVSWEIHNGPIPETYGPYNEPTCVLHHCDNPPCVRPDHLFLGTNDDNNYDKEKKNRQVRGENNGMRKLSDIEIVEIRDLWDKGHHSQQDLADIFGITQSQISRIVRNLRWQHVGEHKDWYGKVKEKGILEKD